MAGAWQSNFVQLNAFQTAAGVTVTPSPVSAIGSVVAPAVIKGSVSITPSPASAIASVIAPSIVLGSVSVTPAYIKAIGQVVAPTVIEGEVVVPTAITQAATNLGNITARINGKISDDGGESCEARFRYRQTDTLFEYYNIGDGGDNPAYGAVWQSQTFTPSTSHIITKVKLKLFRYNLPGIVTVGIRNTDVDGKPTGDDLCSGTIDGDQLTPTVPGQWYEIVFNNSYSLIKDTIYAIVVRAPNGNQYHQVCWRVYLIPGYDRGFAYLTVDSGSNWYKDEVLAFVFEEWGEYEWAETDWQNTLETDDTYYKDLADLEELTEYEFQTQAKNSAGEGAWSASAYFTTVIVPSPIQAIASVVQPTVKQGNIIFSPTPIDAIAKAVSPSVIYGEIIPTPISAIASVVGPVVILSSISITPTYIEAIGQVIPPTVFGAGVVVAPDPIDAIGGSVNPTVILGAITLTPSVISAIAQAVAPTVKQGNIIFSPEFIKALGKAVAPTVIYGSLTLEPESIKAIARGQNPSIILGSMTITPAFVKALTRVIAPTVLQEWVGKKLRLIILTSQYRGVNVITCQNRKVNVVTTQKRKVNVLTGE